MALGCLRVVRIAVPHAELRWRWAADCVRQGLFWIGATRLIEWIVVHKRSFPAGRTE